MTKLEQLIKERCPKGVDFYELQQILEFKNGKGHEKNITSYGKYIVVNSKFISTDGNVKKYSNEQICPLYKNDILMVMSDLPNGKALAKCFIVDEDNKYTLNQRICSLSVKNPNLTNYKFLYYYLNRNRQLLKYDNGVDQTNLKKDNILKIRIPIPPLEIQNTIVRILDNFTKLIAELIAELDARQKQYAYYRDYLLTFDDNNSLIDDIASIDTKNVTYMKLGDISTIVRGASPRPIRNYVTNDIDGVNWIKIGDVKSDSKYIFSTKEKITKDGAEKSRYVCKGDFILSNSMSFGRPYILKIDGCIHDGWLSISGFENYVIADYLYYILVSAPVQREMRKKASFGGAVQNLNSDIVKGLIIPIPSIETQNNIVSILNRFDELCNGISEGLPAEIEARKKQYEYYRDALLSFDEKTCSQIVKVERERAITQ
ncbi:MAG: restriction endonuclease subunit S [Eubacterium sp.]|nr:restriction endonuclease subunit S [Eubacterium sp.]